MTDKDEHPSISDRESEVDGEGGIDVDSLLLCVEKEGEDMENLKSEPCSNLQDDGGDQMDPKAELDTSTLTLPETENPAEEEQEEEEDDLIKFLDTIKFHVLETQNKYEDCNTEFHKLSEEFAIARQLLIENNIPWDPNQPLSPRIKGKWNMAKSSAFKILFVTSMHRLRRITPILLMILGLVILMRESLSLGRFNGCLNPFNFKSAGDYFKYCGGLTHDTLPII